MPLSIRGIEPQSVFGLRGADENSATYALGWVLEKSPPFRAAFLRTVFGEQLDANNSVITLQRHGDDNGFTDLEIESGRSYHAILEAKRGWDVPGTLQLEGYVGRLTSANAERKRLVTVSAASAAVAGRQLPEIICGIAITHLSWADLQRMAREENAASSRFEQRLWLNQLILHLQEFVSMERQTDNTVYVVSLGESSMVPGNNHTWIDVVEKDRCYFHPVGGNNSWPVQPPNYVGFRYRGKLQSVHHIDSFDLIRNLAECNPNWPESEADYFVYRLGPAMRPANTLKTGKIYRNGRVWCAIDTLLSGAFTTISDARDETKRRLNE